MNRRAITLAIATGLVAASALAAPASAYVPVDIGVAKETTNLWMCSGSNPVPSSVAWNIYLSGGTSGNYTVQVTFGDGAYTTLAPIPPGSTGWAKHTFACSHGQVTQVWTASRSGGGTARALTYVETY